MSSENVYLGLIRLSEISAEGWG